MKPFLVVNPRSANGVTARHFDGIAQAVRGAVGEVRHAFTDRAMHAAELTRSALREGCDLIIAAGGDGTLNEVVNGFFEPARPGEPARPVRPQAALALLPRGTGGDFRRSIGLDGDLLRCAGRLKGAAAPVDIGRVDYTADDGTEASRYFINVGEVGVGARVVAIANRSSKWMGGKATFMVASLRALAGWRDLRVRASFDGAPAEDLSVTTLAIANGKFFGGGMMVAPEARLDDGQFHVTIWSGYGLSDFVFKSGSMYDGSHVKLKGTRTLTARTVRLDPADQQTAEVEVDGERLGRLPASFTLLPGALQLVR
ncbi:MAG TPA: YegS/Rv2252/BmrU family lipid kinase [Myxococcales bacterium]|nr:YegS/Rv2252/BmrU family lipid kinase [Myxococcales bacterium]